MKTVKTSYASPLAHKSNLAANDEITTQTFTTTPTSSIQSAW